MAETLERAIIENLDISMFDKIRGIYRLGQKKTRTEREVYYRSNLERLFFGIEGTDFYGYRIGEIVAELLKPDIFNHTEGIDHACLFEDSNLANYKYFLQDLAEDVEKNRSNLRMNYWGLVYEVAQESICKKYLEGQEQLVEILHELSTNQGMVLRGKPELRYITKNEADSAAKLFNFIQEEKGKSGFSNFPKKLKNIMDATLAYFGYKTQSKPRQLQEHDIHSQLKSMENKTLTLYFFDLPEGGKNYPIGISFRSKTLRSTRAKAARAYTALIALHQEGHMDRILDDFPFILEELSKNGGGKLEEDYLSIIEQVDCLNLGYSFKDKFTTRQKKSNWKKSEISRQKKQMMWSKLDLETRSLIVEQEGLSRVFQKYNTWQDVVNVFNDLIGMTFIYDGKTDFLSHLDNKVIPGFYQNTSLKSDYPCLSIVPKKIDPQSNVDVIDRPGWQAAHFDLRMSHRNPTIPATESHVLGINELAESITTLSGEYAHPLRPLRLRSDFFDDVSDPDKYKDIEDLMSRRVGEKRPRNALLECVKEKFKDMTIPNIYSDIRFKRSEKYI